ncbi:hypothetical protein [Chryseobacterium sp. CT-SW4]|uniref:hypothetical protein n=1 Tax=Chryseobacterium sp. SW-1 TaxID=3157343 RepID=UPI003B01E859
MKIKNNSLTQDLPIIHIYQTRIKLILISFLLINLISCSNKKENDIKHNINTYNWNAAISSPKFYPVGDSRVDFGYASAVGDDGAVLESEISQNSWIFTTVFTPESDTQPFSGHRQFGIHKDEEGNYRFFARAIDRVWPSSIISLLNGKENSVLDYLTIADATWNNLMKNVSNYINKTGGGGNNYNAR